MYKMYWSTEIVDLLELEHWSTDDLDIDFDNLK